MQWIKRTGSLDLNDDGRFDQKVRAVSAHDAAVEDNLERSLALYTKTAFVYGHRHRVRVHGLEKPSAQLRMNDEEATEDCARYAAM